MHNADRAALRREVLRRLRSGETVAAVAADCCISRSTVYRWKRESTRAATKPPARRPVEGYLGDMTGPGITDVWGVTCTDLGVCAVAPNGKLVSVFGDTFSGNKVGEGHWRAPVALIGSGDANNLIEYENAGGADESYAQQLWPYVHDDHPGAGAASAP